MAYFKYFEVFFNDLRIIPHQFRPFFIIFVLAPGIPLAVYVNYRYYIGDPKREVKHERASKLINDKVREGMSRAFMGKFNSNRAAETKPLTAEEIIEENVKSVRENDIAIQKLKRRTDELHRKLIALNNPRRNPKKQNDSSND